VYEGGFYVWPVSPGGDVLGGGEGGFRAVGGSASPLSGWLLFSAPQPQLIILYRWDRDYHNVSSFTPDRAGLAVPMGGGGGGGGLAGGGGCVVGGWERVGSGIVGGRSWEQAT